MSKLKRLLGVEPILENEKEKIYSPSKSALKIAVKSKTDYDNSIYNNAYKGNDLKILIIGTEQNKLVMENDKSFATGNHPVETFVPMLHWQKAGFSFDFATINGQEMQLEQWAMPLEDKAVMELYETNKHFIKNPLSLKKLSANLDDLKYTAVFIPGGHGAIIDLPYSLEVKEIVQWAFKNEKYIISICHGPAAFLAASKDEAKDKFPFKGYKIAAFPDGNDKLLPSLGYLPGQMPWFFGEELKKFGVTIVNKLANGTVHQDRKVITGDSPMAANKLGKLSSELLLAEIN